MSLSLIVAMTPDRLIGRDNSLPWRLSEDLKRFKQITMGHPIIMGRKTYDSIGKPLPGRRNIVLSRQADFDVEGVELANSWDEAVAAVGHMDAFVIGGRALFEMAMPVVDKVFLTLVNEKIEGDAYFPEVDWEASFEVAERSGEQKSEKGLKYEFIDYVRKA